MNDVNVIHSQNPDFKFIKVIFNSSAKIYTYKTTESFSVGDHCIVDSPSVGYTVVKVVQVIPFDELDQDVEYKFKWAVQKLDTDQYLHNTAMDTKIINDLSKAKNVIKRKSRIQELTELLGEDYIK